MRKEQVSDEMVRGRGHSCCHAASADRPSQVVVESNEDLTKDSHLMPKVMVPFETRPGETPRKVQIQRSA